MVKNPYEASSLFPEPTPIATHLDQVPDQPIPTGFAALDKGLNGGLRPGTLTVISGITAVGTSTFARGIARSAAFGHGRPALLATTEETTQHAANRILAAEAAVHIHRIENRDYDTKDAERVQRATTTIADAPLYIDTATGWTVPQFERFINDDRGQRGLQMLVVDRLELLNDQVPEAPTRAEQIAAIGRGFKRLALNLDLAVVVVAGLKTRPSTGTAPELHNLGDGAGLEADADVVILLHRDDQFDPNAPRGGEADLIVAKNRQGLPFTAMVAFQGHYSRFVDMAWD